MEKKGLLINYNGPPREIFNLFPDNGLAILASVMIHEGHDIKILDFITPETYKRFCSPRISETLEKLRLLTRNAPSIIEQRSTNPLLRELHALYRQVEEEIALEICSEAEKFSPQFIGFKLWGGWGTEGSFHIARMVKKKYPGIFILAGGPQVDVFREEILASAPQIDFLIHGEGEQSLLCLLEAFKGKLPFSSVPGLIYREGSTIITNKKGDFVSLSGLPSPLYDPSVYPAMEEGKIRIFLIEESRGCPNSCNFCIHPRKSGNCHRTKKLEDLEEEIERTANAFETPFFRLSGSNPPQALLSELAEKISGKGYIYSAFGNIHMPEIFPLLAESGCASLAFGVESGSPCILEKAMNKHINPQKIKETLIRSRKGGIFTIASIIIPAPYDDETTIEETLCLLKEAHPDSVTTQFALLTPETSWWERAEEFGFKFSDKSMLKRKLLTYKEDFLLPIDLIERIPYRIGRFNHNAIIRTAMNFNAELEKSGIATGISDFLVLCAHSLGKDPLEFRRLTDEILGNQRYDELSMLVREMNHKLNSIYTDCVKGCNDSTELRLSIKKRRVHGTGLSEPQCDDYTPPDSGL